MTHENPQCREGAFLIWKSLFCSGAEGILARQIPAYNISLMVALASRLSKYDSSVQVRVAAENLLKSVDNLCKSFDAGEDSLIRTASPVCTYKSGQESVLSSCSLSSDYSGLDLMPLESSDTIDPNDKEIEFFLKGSLDQISNICGLPEVPSSDAKMVKHLLDVVSSVQSRIQSKFDTDEFTVIQKSIIEGFKNRDRAKDTKDGVIEGIVSTFLEQIYEHLTSKATMALSTESIPVQGDKQVFLQSFSNSIIKKADDKEEQFLEEFIPEISAALTSIG